jgi:hypothetical protein
MPTDTGQKTHTMVLSEEERTVLLDLLQQALAETRVEVHRTHTPSFRDQVLHEEALIRRLVQKLGQLTA